LSQILRSEPGTRLERLLVGLAEDSRDDDEIAGDLVEAIRAHPVRSETFATIHGIDRWATVGLFDQRAVVEREAWRIAFEEGFPCAAFDWPMVPSADGELTIRQASALYYHQTRRAESLKGLDAGPLHDLTSPSKDPGFNVIWRFATKPAEVVLALTKLDVPAVLEVEVTWARMFEFLLIWEAGRLCRETGSFEALLDCVPFLCSRLPDPAAIWWLPFWSEELKKSGMNAESRASAIACVPVRAVHAFLEHNVSTDPDVVDEIWRSATTKFFEQDSFASRIRATWSDGDGGHEGDDPPPAA